MNEIVVDFTALESFAAGEKILELNLVDIFLAELERLKRIVAGMGLSAADGEDVLQDVSLRALKQSDKFETRQECIRWFIRVTINQCLAEHRRRRTFRRKAGEILKRRQQDKMYQTDKKAILSEELEIVRESLQKLDESLLGPVVLRYFCDLDSKEISRILEVKSSTVRGRLRDARLILAKGLLERGVEP
ncbi:MAG: sigma-70 family RNA polymerase sigma factor [Sedimentisphaerales bacterium]|nr:sigma-70 family RNA polymerase sigma factor [Sedimentisphaerales bacterium]